MEQEFLTAKEVSRLSKIHPLTPYKWVKRNALPFLRLGEKSVRFRKSNIEFFVEKGRGQELRYRKKDFGKNLF